MLICAPQKGFSSPFKTAYHSFGGEVEASNTPTIRRLIPSRRHQLSPIAPFIGRRARAMQFKRRKRTIVAGREGSNNDRSSGGSWRTHSISRKRVGHH